MKSYPQAAPEPVERRRYTARLVVLETHEMAEQVVRMAEAAGHSTAAEVRQALRYWLQAKSR